MEVTILKQNFDEFESFLTDAIERARSDGTLSAEGAEVGLYGAATREYPDILFTAFEDAANDCIRSIVDALIADYPAEQAVSKTAVDT